MFLNAIKMSHLLKLKVSTKVFSYYKNLQLYSKSATSTSIFKNLKNVQPIKIHRSTVTTDSGNNGDIKRVTLPVNPLIKNVITTPKTLDEPHPLKASEVKWHHCPGIYASLSKWYLSWFVVITTDAGYCLAPVQFDLPLFYAVTIGTLLCAFSANSFNQISEVKLDGLMDRTKKRPLVQGIITPLHAKTFAVMSGITGVSCLYFGVNTLTATLGALNIGLYAMVYTPLKQLHWSNTWVGSIVGAIPPVMGWTAATGQLDAGAFIFAGILYAWQFPHFFALAWRRRADYARGSYKMLPLSHPNGTKLCVLAHSMLLCGLSVAAPLTHVSTWSFVAMSAPVNAWLMLESIKFYRHGSSRSAKSLYKCSLYYIILISAALIADRKLIPQVKVIYNNKKENNFKEF